MSGTIEAWRAFRVWLADWVDPRGRVDLELAEDSVLMGPCEVTYIPPLEFTEPGGGLKGATIRGDLKPGDVAVKDSMIGLGGA